MFDYADIIISVLISVGVMAAVRFLETRPIQIVMHACVSGQEEPTHPLTRDINQ